MSKPGPLAGVRVLDLTTMVSGPVAAMLLGDQGADVIKIESHGGDLMRNFGTSHKGVSGAFLSTNRNKRSLCVDIKKPEGLEIVRKLVPTADVLLQNFRPGAIERMGLGEADVRKLRKDIIFVSISGFGDKGPYSHQRVYDPVIQGLCGLAEIQADRHPAYRPRMVRAIVPDKTTSFAAAQAVCAALFARERTGEGQHIRIAMLDVMIAYLWPESISSLTFPGHEVDPARAQMGPDLVYQTRDGFITAGAVSDVEWQGMCKAFGREDLLADPRFATVAERTKHIAERRTAISEELLRWDSKDILAKLDANGVPCAPILKRTDLLEDEQVRINRMIEEHEHPVAGKVRQPRPAAQFDRTPAAIRSLAPALGEHNAQILQELGYAESRIAELAASKVLKG
jgi:crotonobetainyl-CoA:carnitine CoA-transferase CaiB-like acyl-CoA transferase